MNKNTCHFFIFRPREVVGCFPPQCLECCKKDGCIKGTVYDVVSCHKKNCEVPECPHCCYWDRKKDKHLPDPLPPHPVPVCPWPLDSKCHNPYCLVSPACPTCCSRNACIRGTAAQIKLCQHKRCKHMLPTCPSCCNSTPGATCLLLECGYPHCRN